MPTDALLVEVEQTLVQQLDGSPVGVEGPGTIDAALQDAEEEASELFALAGELRDGQLALEQRIRSQRNRELAEATAQVGTLRQQRAVALTAVSPARRQRELGFGPAGVKNAGDEVRSATLRGQAFGHSVPSLGRQLAQDFRRSPVPPLAAAVKLLLLFVAFAWWRRRAARVIDGAHERAAQQRPSTRASRLWSAITWYAARVRQPLEWMIVLWTATRMVESLDHVPSLTLLRTAVLWFAGGALAIKAVDAVIARDDLRKDKPSPTAGLRTRTIASIGLWAVALGWIRATLAEVVGAGTLYRWVTLAGGVALIPVAFVIVRRWQPTILRRMNMERDHSRVAALVARHGQGMTGMASAAFGGVYLLARGMLRWLIVRLSGPDATRRLLAYLFRREAARQAGARPAATNVAPIADGVRTKMRTPDVIHDPLPAAIERSLAQIQQTVDGPHATISAVISERGGGKSFVLRRLQRAFDERPTLFVQCPAGGFDSLLRALGSAAGSPSSTPASVAQALRQDKGLLIIVDDVQRLIKPALRGLRDLDRFTAFVREVGGSTAWVVGFGVAAWRYLRCARGDKLFFDRVVELPAWGEDDIAALIRARTEQAQLVPNYRQLAMPPQYDDERLTEEERKQRGYFRILWEYARGNPAVACHFWGQSLFADDEGDTVVRMFEEPRATDLTNLALPIKFVLRSIVQLELASAGDIAECTQLPEADVAEALRFATAQSYVERHQDRYRLSWPWYRAVTNMLQRQHLLLL